MEEDDDFETLTCFPSPTAAKTNISNRRKCERGSLPEPTLRHAAKKSKSYFQSLRYGKENIAFDLTQHPNSCQSATTVFPSLINASMTDTLTYRARIQQTNESDVVENNTIAPIQSTQTKMSSTPNNCLSAIAALPSLINASMTETITDQARIQQTNESDVADNDTIAPLELTQTKMLSTPSTVAISPSLINASMMDTLTIQTRIQQPFESDVVANDSIAPPASILSTVNNCQSVMAVFPPPINASMYDTLTNQAIIQQTNESDVVDNDIIAPLELTQTKMLSPPNEEPADSIGEIDGSGLINIANEDELETMGTKLDALIQLCSDNGDITPDSHSRETIKCPLCEIDLSGWDNESKHLHTNACLDNSTTKQVSNNLDNHDSNPDNTTGFSTEICQLGETTPVIQWLRTLGLDKYRTNFIKHEIDWASLQWLNEADLINIGIVALGPRKKILQSLDELKEGKAHPVQVESKESKSTGGKIKNHDMNQLITDFFSGPGIIRSGKPERTAKDQLIFNQKQVFSRKVIPGRKHGDIPPWCRIPGTRFCVDAFRYPRRDCLHWFLTHFHTDHYQGLTRSFSYGSIYCSTITAKLVNLKIGITWDKLKVLPLNEKINIDGVQVTCFDANHCPGSLIILFEPPNGEAVLHTGDFRFSEEMKTLVAAISCPIHTLILDTTYCDPKYDFPKQEAVIQFVVEAIQAESFNPKTLFLIGSYTIGKERLFFEVARILHKKVYVTPAKLKLLGCLGLHQEDTQWLTTDERESHIHIVPIWTLANFKRLKQLSLKYVGQFSSVVAFSPTGWTFGKGKKSAAGRRWQQGTIIRYEVPYSEHCSFTELKEFVQLLSPVNVIPSVNNEGDESSKMMLAHLYS